jgi:hypothetical protein
MRKLLDSKLISVLNRLATSDFKNKAGLTNTVKVDVDNQEKPQGNCSC